MAVLGLCHERALWPALDEALGLSVWPTDGFPSSHSHGLPVLLCGHGWKTARWTAAPYLRTDRGPWVRAGSSTVDRTAEGRAGAVAVCAGRT